MRIHSTLWQLAFLFIPFFSAAQHFEMTAVPSGSSIHVYLKPVGGNISTGFTDVEFFFRNPTTSSDPGFTGATVNTTDFPNVLIPYNGMNIQGTEDGYDNYWFGISFALTPSRTYNQGQEYLLCTVPTSSPANGLGLELCHNEPNFLPHYIALTDGGGNDLSSQVGNKFYGSGVTSCNCPVSTPGVNFVLPLSAPLPVEHVSFYAEKKGINIGQLTWKSAAEEGCRSFIVERSDATRNWKTLGEVVAQGNNSSYIFIDENPPKGVAYYRLKQLDYNGKFEYSPVRILLFGSGLAAKFYPNPVSNWLKLELGDGIDYSATIHIQFFNLQGALVRDHQLYAEQNTSLDVQLGRNVLPAGEYLLVAKNGGKVLLNEMLTVVDSN